MFAFFFKSLGLLFLVLILVNGENSMYFSLGLVSVIGCGASILFSSNWGSPSELDMFFLQALDQ
jgi:hypothetical protein